MKKRLFTEKQIDKIAGYILLLALNLSVFFVAKYFDSELTPAKCIIYSVFNSVWMLVAIMPIVDRGEGSDYLLELKIKGLFSGSLDKKDKPELKEVEEQSHTPEQVKKDSTTYMELEEFLYLSDKMVINNKTATDTKFISAFIKDKDENELVVVKEEIRYLMFCLLHVYTYAEVVVNKKLIDFKDERAMNHFKNMTYDSLERAFLTSLNDFDYSVEKYKDRYAKYAEYLAKYNHQNFERSFVECFAAQLTGEFDDDTEVTDIDFTPLMLTARWVFRTYGEITKATISKQNFIL